MPLVLGQAKRDPGDHQPEEPAAGIAHESARAMVPWGAQVPQQEAGQRAADDEHTFCQAVVAGIHGSRAKHRQRCQRQRTRQAVGTINHVQGIDQANRGEHGERDRPDAQVQAGKPESRTQLPYTNATPQGDDPTRQHLKAQPPVPAHLMMIVVHADGDHDQRGHTQAGDLR